MLKRQVYSINGAGKTGHTYLNNEIRYHPVPIQIKQLSTQNEPKTSIYNLEVQNYKKKNVEEPLQDIDAGTDFLDRTPVPQATQKTVRFYQTKSSHNETNQELRESTEWKKIFENFSYIKKLMSKL